MAPEVSGEAARRGGVVGCRALFASKPVCAAQRMTKTRGHVRGSHFVLRHWHSPTAFDRIG